MKKPKLVISRKVFDAKAIAAALQLDEGKIVEALRDGRGAWPFSELWGAELYDFVKHSNSNKPLSVGAVVLEQLRDVDVSVKALTGNGIKFQQSKFVGFGRTATQADLIQSLESCDRVVIVDITCFPAVDFIPVDGTRLVTAAHTNSLTTRSWSKAKFYGWLGTTYDVSMLNL